MKFFNLKLTADQKIGCTMATTGAAIGGTILSGFVGFIASGLIAYQNASNFLEKSGCNPSSLWRYKILENLTQACGEVCLPVCEKALEIYGDNVSEWWTGITVAGGAVATAATLVYLYRTYSKENQENSELQELTTSSKLNSMA